MKPETEFAIAHGLSLLSADDMRSLLFQIATFDVKRDVEKAIEFSYFARTIINDKILEKLHEAKNEVQR
jgi:hypothetical protein